ncbi:NAD-aldehyde dehydrogenase [Trametes elegans]|nr:NAD-aldehyde dehydrogenase [Trametes elegans]
MASNSTLTYTPIDEIEKIHARARAAFESGRTASLAFRKEQIAQLAYLLRDNEDRLRDALRADLGRPPLETDLMDFGSTYTDIKHTYDNFEKWARPQAIDFSTKYFPMGPKITPEPKGTVLIMPPFNFPLFLSLGPLASVIAAGDAAVLKPSEQTPATSALLAELIPKYLDHELYHVVNGGVAENTKLLELKWDHILYIGNGRVGRIIATAAAKHLTPVTLELGGKNPVVIDPKVDLDMTTRRLLWGRFTNAGQICVCPDYVLVPEDFQDTLVDALKREYHKFYPDGAENSDSLSRIISEAHAARIKRMVDETKGTIVAGGQADVARRLIAPTIVRDVPADDSLMSDEIFGPVLPIVPVRDVDEAIAFIRARDHPLVVYVFSEDPKFQDKGAYRLSSALMFGPSQLRPSSPVFKSTKSGAAVTNDTILSPGVPGLPIGGIGPSGYGYYSGRHAFEEFSHQRVSLKNPKWVDKIGFSFRFPPYQDHKRLLRKPALPPRPGTSLAAAAAKKWGVWIVLALVGASSVLLTKSGQLARLKSRA